MSYIPECPECGEKPDGIQDVVDAGGNCPNCGWDPVEAAEEFSSGNGDGDES